MISHTAGCNKISADLCYRGYKSLRFYPLFSLEQKKHWPENQKEISSVHSLNKSQSHSHLQNIIAVLDDSQSHSSSKNMTL